MYFTASFISVGGCRYVSFLPPKVQTSTSNCTLFELIQCGMGSGLCWSLEHVMSWPSYEQSWPRKLKWGWGLGQSIDSRRTLTVYGVIPDWPHTDMCQFCVQNWRLGSRDTSYSQSGSGEVKCEPKLGQNCFKRWRTDCSFDKLLCSSLLLGTPYPRWVGALGPPKRLSPLSGTGGLRQHI